MDLTWHDLHHTDLTVVDLHDVLALRNRVFVVEVRDGEVGVVQVVPGEVHERILAAGGLAFVA